MGNFEIELNKNNSPVVSATELELEYLRSNMGMSNIEEVRSRLKEFGLLAYFLARNFYDRDGKLDELKLTNWIKNSFRKLNYYVGESTTTFSFDDTNLTNDIGTIDEGDYLDDALFKCGDPLQDLNIFSETDTDGVRITKVIEVFNFDYEKSKDFLVLIDAEVGG